MGEMICRICGSNSISETFIAKEMLQGSREPFEYFVCDNCSTVQISSTDLDMTKYYNSSYYSLSNDNSKQSNLFVRIRNRHVFQRKNGLFGNLLQYLFPIYKEHAIIGSLVKSDTRILDIGCGNGDFLKLMHSVGYQYLTGIEPYLTDSIKLDTHFHLIKGNLHSINSNFDLIRLHHVFEHVSDPVTTLNQIYQLLDDEGIVVLTIPIADYVFSNYKHNAYLIQAPHHFQLFTISGIVKLVEKNNFKINSVFRNAKGISNWIYISELWKRNISQQEANQSAKSILSKKEMLQFKQQEAELTKLSKGDNVTLILSKQL